MMLLVTYFVKMRCVDEAYLALQDFEEKGYRLGTPYVLDRLLLIARENMASGEPTFRRDEARTESSSGTGTPSADSVSGLENSKSREVHVASDERVVRETVVRDLETLEADVKRWRNVLVSYYHDDEPSIGAESESE